MEVAPERLFHDQPVPAPVVLAGESGGGEVRRGRAEVFGRRGQIEEIIFADLGAFGQIFEFFGEALVGFGIVEFALKIMDVDGELFPDFLIDRFRVGELPQRFPQVLPKFLDRKSTRLNSSH